MNYSAPVRNKGFTLIELAIAIAVIGIIVAMLFNKFGKSFITTAKSESVYSNAQQVAESWKMLSNLCGTSLDPNVDNLTKSGGGWTSNYKLLRNPEDSTYGVDTVKYRRCYAQSGFTGLPIISIDANKGYSGWANLVLGDYPTAIQPNGSFKFAVYLFVPNDIAEQLWLNYNSIGSTSFNTGANESSDTIYHYIPNATISGFTQVHLYF